MKTTTEIAETRTAHTEQGGTVRHITKVVERQDWANTPANGIYAGKSYKITTLFSSTVAGYRHIMTGRSSEPFTA